MSQEFDNKVLDLVKRKEFYPHEYMKDFKKTNEQLPSKEKLCCSLTGKKIAIKNINLFLRFGIHFR